MDACAGNVTDVCKIGQELLMSVRNFGYGLDLRLARYFPSWIVQTKSDYMYLLATGSLLVFLFGKDRILN